MLVATIGRLHAHLHPYGTGSRAKPPTLSLDDLRHLIVDEADSLYIEGGTGEVAHLPSAPSAVVVVVVVVVLTRPSHP